MNSKEFYQFFDSIMKPVFIAKGYKKLKGKASRWVLTVNGGCRFLLFRTHTKYSWTVYGGGKFTLDAFWGDGSQTTPDEADLLARINPFVHLDDASFSKMSIINAKVHQKIESLGSDFLLEQLKHIGAKEDDVRLLHSSSIEISKANLLVSRSQINPKFCYYDADDILLWTEFFSTYLDAITSSIKEHSVNQFKDV